jgi:hypothetical protein
MEEGGMSKQKLMADHHQSVTAQTPQFEAAKRMLDSNDLRQEYGFGRDLALALLKRLPHVSTGTSGKNAKLLVHRNDLEAFLNYARFHRADLWKLVKQHNDFSSLLEGVVAA